MSNPLQDCKNIFNLFFSLTRNLLIPNRKIKANLCQYFTIIIQKIPTKGFSVFTGIPETYHTKMYKNCISYPRHLGMLQVIYYFFKKTFLNEQVHKTKVTAKFPSPENHYAALHLLDVLFQKCKQKDCMENIYYFPVYTTHQKNEFHDLRLYYIKDIMNYLVYFEIVF